LPAADAPVGIPEPRICRISPSRAFRDDVRTHRDFATSTRDRATDGSGVADGDVRAMFHTAAPLYGVDGGPSGTPAHADSIDTNVSTLQVRFVIMASALR
jgi:hypothetical protein